MADTESLIPLGTKQNANRKDKTGNLPCHWAVISILFWIFLFFGIVIPYLYRLPKANTLEDVGKNEFIAERAYKDLYTLSNIGTKIIGSQENAEAVEFLLQKLGEIKENSLKDFFDIEIDVSQASGQSVIFTELSVYKGVQNIVVKFSPKGSTSEKFILVNSHFDSKPHTPSAGDAGSMIVVMLEVLRVMSTTRQSFEHPIVFLFNGAEELGLLASHGFVTQHKWAPYCKALINLDAAGTGGREVLFQTGPNHPWLVKYYKKYAKYPFATTLAEELFQAGIIPSDTDFRIFKNVANIPGLDMAQCINGEVYHTKYDTIDVIPRESLQNTGDNALGLVRGMSNATEIFNMEAHNTGNSVFFDFLGVYFIHYTESSGKSLNIGTAVVAFLLVLISMWRMSLFSQVSLSSIICSLILVLIVQIISFALGIVLPLVVAYVFDAMGLSLVYYSTPLLIIGLYVCSSLIGLALPITIYYSVAKNDKISCPYHLQLSLHSQAFILSLLVITITMMNIRSSYIFMIPLLFYTLSLVLNLITPLHDRGYSWARLVSLSQIIPFLYASYLAYALIVVLTPMGARAGSGANRDLYIAGLAAFGTVLSCGFLVPLINTFRRPGLVIYCLITITVISMFLASSTQLGFPYRPRTSGQRISYVHTRNKFYEYDGTLSKDESGYLFYYQDRRKETAIRGSNVNLTGLVSLKSRCDRHMMCGTAMPMFSTCASLPSGCGWLPRSDPIVPPGSTKMQLLSKTIKSSTTVRLEFNVTGTSQMHLYFQTYDDVKISNWSFLKSYLESPPAYPEAYGIFYNHGIDNSPLNFFVEISKQKGDFNVPLIQIGIITHYIGSTLADAQTKELSASMPDYAIVQDWPATYDRYIY